MNQANSSNTVFSAAAPVIMAWQRPLLLSHVRPDGDALGCLIAMGAILRQLGRAPVALLYEPCPNRYRSLLGAGELRVMCGDHDPSLESADGVMILDTCTYSQLGPVADWLRRTDVPKLALDHHQTRDELADHYLVDEQAAAASLIVYRWACLMGWPIPEAASNALFVGIATDTGWFRYSNTSSEALRAAADLVEGGVDLDAIHRRLYLSEPASALRCRAAAISRIELLREDTVAIMTLTQDMLNAARATAADTEELVNYPMTVAAVELSVLLVEQADGRTKCSFRSKGGIDVARLAGAFGGGGHSRAAGAYIRGTIGKARQAILDRIESAGT